MRELLWIGDTACQSGFGRASHHILKQIHGHGYNVTALGVNYLGDGHDEPYRVYPAWPGKDPLGIGRLREGLPGAPAPDVVVLQCNPWNVPAYKQYLPKNIPVIGIIAVEGKNCRGRDLNQLDRAIFWTEFGRMEAWQGGLECSKPSTVIPLGVDRQTYTPGDRNEARRSIGMSPEILESAFIFGNVNRNQFRKRLDLSIQYFSKWFYANGRPNAYLLLHALGGSGRQFDLEDLAVYFGVAEHLILIDGHNSFNGIAEHKLVQVMRSFDVGITTALGEGFGLPALEMMAAGIPVLGGRYAAYEEWADGAMGFVPCTSEGVMPDVQYMIGGTPDQSRFVELMQRCFSDDTYRNGLRQAGLAKAAELRFDWVNIGERFRAEIDAV